MKRVKLLVVLVVALMIFSAIAFAQETDEMKRPMMDKRMKKAQIGKHYMGGIMMKMMKEKQMVVTEDGGVIVMVGNKLLKYDGDLNLVKEVELKIDIEACYKMMKLMKEEYPWHKEMMKEEEKEVPDKE